jgi:hypothetical protein
MVPLQVKVIYFIVITTFLLILCFLENGAGMTAFDIILRKRLQDFRSLEFNYDHFDIFHQFKQLPTTEKRTLVSLHAARKNVEFLIKLCTNDVVTYDPEAQVFVMEMHRISQKP